MSSKRLSLFYALFFFAGIGTAVLTSKLLKVTAREIVPATKAPKAAPVRVKSDKPWGTIEALKVPLAEDSEMFSDREARLAPPRWFFENMSQAQVIELLKTTNLTELQRSELMQNSKWLLATN